MSLYWIYDIATWQLAVLIVAVFLFVTLAGLFLTRPFMRRMLGGSPEYNELVSFFLSALGVFYGLALGLIAVGTWENFSDVDATVSKEAAAIASLYNDLDSLPQPMRRRLEEKLRIYTRFVIEKEWPAQHQGEILQEGGTKLEGFEDELMSFEPTKEQQKIAQSEVVKSLNQVVEQRQMRRQAVNTALPASLWSIVIIGALLTILLTYLFWIDKLLLHVMLVCLLTTFMALLVFLIAAMDNPFRGEFSVSSDVYQNVLDSVMKPETPQVK